MKTAPEIKSQLIEALSDVLDEPLKGFSFTRNKRSLVYARNANVAEHRITFILHCHPKYQPDAEAHIYPSLQVLMPQVSDIALALVKGDKLLLANAPDIIIGQPVDFTAPKNMHQRWFATDNAQFVTACASIKAFLDAWVLPFFSEVSTATDLVRLYEANEARVMKYKHWYVFIAAAYEVSGQPNKARKIVREQFSSPGLRKLYAPLFESLAIG